MALILRSTKGSSLTNDELDGNFVFLNTQDGLLSNKIDTINDVSIPTLQTDLLALLGDKQPLNARLTNFADMPSSSADGLVVNVGNTIVTRQIVSNSPNLQVTNGSGIAGDVSISLSDDIVTQDGQQILSRKTISGVGNVLVDVPLETAVSGVLSVEHGGTGSTTAIAARTALEAARAPAGAGVVVQTNQDTTKTIAITSSGLGLSVSNSSGLDSGSIVINSNATAQASPNTLVSRDNNGNFSANTITATLNGHATTAGSVPNGVVTTVSYSNPSWITSLLGSKVYSIPNSSLQNSTITINGQIIPLGSAADIHPSGTSTNTPNQTVRRDAFGNFAAGTITANLNGHAASAGSVVNGVVTTGSYSNPNWITSLLGSKVYSIPNTSLINNSVTINGVTVNLGDSVNIPSLTATALNLPGQIVQRDASGNFAAGTITATLNGNATSATSASSAAAANKLAVARTINGVAFDGTQNITVADSTKLPLSGGSISGQLEAKLVEYTYNAGTTGTSFTPNWLNGTIQTVTASSSFTLQLPANMPSGSSLTIIVTQDGAGGRVMTAASSFKFAGGFKTLSVIGNSVDMINIFRAGSTYFATLTTGYV